jgi:hypothetical protein
MQLFQAEVRAAIGAGDHCTLCTLLVEGDDSRIQSFLRELGNDGHVLEPIWDAWGFCPWHMWKVAWIEHTQRGAVLTMALLAQELLRRVARATQSADGVAVGSIPEPPAPGNACSLCQRITTSQTHWLGWLLDNGMLSAPKLEASPLVAVEPRFCIPHLGQVYQYLRQHREANTRLITERFSAARAFVCRYARLHRSPAASLGPRFEEPAWLALPPTRDQAMPWQAYVTATMARVAGGCNLPWQVAPAFPTRLHTLPPLPGISADSLDTKEHCWMCLEEARQATTLCDEAIHDQVLHRAAGSAAFTTFCHGHAWLLAERLIVPDVGAGTPARVQTSQEVRRFVFDPVSTPSFVDLEQLQRLCEGLAQLEQSYDEQLRVVQSGSAAYSGEKKRPQEVTSERCCIMCDACASALEQCVQASIRSGTFLSRADTLPESAEHLCLRHWQAFDWAAKQQGRHDVAEQLYAAQCTWRQAVSQDLDTYLRSFSVSTRDPHASAPGPRAWQRALMLLVGLPPGLEKKGPFYASKPEKPDA